MQKILTIGIALALTIAFTNLALAAEFDPIADLASGDALLGLDLPTDFTDLEPIETPSEVEEEPVETAPTQTEPVTTLQLPATTTTGSGGAIGEEVLPAVPATQPATQDFSTPASQQFLTSHPASTSIVDASYDYSRNTASRAQLTPTGPVATLVVAVLAALGLTVLLRKKFVHV